MFTLKSYIRGHEYRESRQHELDVHVANDTAAREIESLKDEITRIKNSVS